MFYALIKKQRESGRKRLEMRKLDYKNNYIDGNCKQNKDIDSKIDERMKKRRRRIKKKTET